MAITQRENFTTGRLEAFTCPADKKQTFLWDTKAHRLGVRATPSGSKSYIFETKFAGATIRITLGDIRTWSIDKARQEARRMQLLADGGTDPRKDKADKLAASATATQEQQRVETLTLEIWKLYMEARKSKWGDQHYRDHELAIKPGGTLRTRGRRKGESDYTQPGEMVELLNCPLRALTPERVKNWLLTEVARRPTRTRLMFGLLRAFLNWCADHPDYKGLAQADACSSRIGREYLEKKGVKKDCLQREQLAAWFSAVRALPNPVISAYLQGLLLTGARREELALLKWEDIDFRWKSMSLRDKVEGRRTIPLTQRMAEILEALPRNSEWVFASRTAKAGYIQEPRKAHNQALATAALPVVTLHGLRRTFKTLSEWVECPAGVTAQLMGHKPSATAERHYVNRSLDFLHVWHQRIENWTIREAGLSPKAAAHSYRYARPHGYQPPSIGRENTLCSA